MPGPSRSASEGRTPILVPCLMFRSGKIMLPGPDGPVAARSASGTPFDLLDVVDSLTSKYSRLLVVDLDGVDRGRPQLDYLQEICRDADVWVDGGVRTADQAIDILLTGAQRAILSTAMLSSPKQLTRAWKMSTNLVVELEVRSGRVRSPSPEWDGGAPRSVVEQVASVGVPDVLYSPREGDVDWSLVGDLHSLARLWVNGSFQRFDVPRLIEVGAAGGVCHIEEELAAMSVPAPAGPPARRPRSTSQPLPRDDDT